MAKTCACGHEAKKHDIMSEGIIMCNILSCTCKREMNWTTQLILSDSDVEMVAKWYFENTTLAGVKEKTKWKDASDFVKKDAIEKAREALQTLNLKTAEEAEQRGYEKGHNDATDGSMVWEIKKQAQEDLLKELLEQIEKYKASPTRLDSIREWAQAKLDGEKK